MKHKQYNKLEGYKKEHGITNQMIAEALGITETSVVRKNKGKSDYYISEIFALEEKLNIPCSIFLP